MGLVERADLNWTTWGYYIANLKVLSTEDMTLSDSTIAVTFIRKLTSRKRINLSKFAPKFPKTKVKKNFAADSWKIGLKVTTAWQKKVVETKSGLHATKYKLTLFSMPQCTQSSQLKFLLTWLKS